MTIGVDVRVLLDARYSGVAEYTLNLLQAIIREDKVNNYVLFYNSAKNLDHRLPQLASPRVSFVRRRWPNKLLNYGLFKFFGRPRVDKLIGRQIDVWWMPHLNFIGWPRAKSILTIHDLSFLRYPEFFSARKNFWHRQLNVPKLVRRADRLVAISENTKQDLLELGGVNAEKISVIPSGVSAAYRVLNEADLSLKTVKDKYQLPDKFILYLGTIEPRKNLVGLVEAYNFLRQQHPESSDCQLVLAGGNGWKFKEVYQAAQRSPYTADIKFLGYIPAADKGSLYNLAKVLAFPSFYEGFGFPPLEAMACGTPVVASFAASLPEVVGEAGILIDPYNLNDLAEALAQVLTNEELSQKLTERGLARAREFGWDKAAAEYLQIFNN